MQHHFLPKVLQIATHALIDGFEVMQSLNVVILIRLYIIILIRGE